MRFADVHRIDASLDRDELPLDPLVDLATLAGPAGPQNELSGLSPW